MEWNGRNLMSGLAPVVCIRTATTYRTACDGERGGQAKGPCSTSLRVGNIRPRFDVAIEFCVGLDDFGEGCGIRRPRGEARLRQRLLQLRVSGALGDDLRQFFGEVLRQVRRAEQ